jgi:hypothetical protein
MVKGWNINLSVYFIHGTFANVMFKSYLWLNVEYNSTYAINGNFNCDNHLH